MVQGFIPGLGKKFSRWLDVPHDVPRDFDASAIGNFSHSIGGGVPTQRELEVVFGTLRKELDQRGVVLTDADSALRDYPDLIRRYFLGRGRLRPITRSLQCAGVTMAVAFASHVDLVFVERLDDVFAAASPDLSNRLEMAVN